MPAAPALIAPRPAAPPAVEPRSRAEALLAPLEQFGVRLGLERVRRLADAFGRPHLACPTVLVAGTNGKGSTAALLASIAAAAGYRAGLYTSPHLEAVTERVRVDGRAVDDDRLAEALELVLARAGAEPPTYFETVTLAAFLLFRDAGLDLAVVEVGLGGRLDATNVCEPLVSIVSAIGLDHEAQLGGTPEAIAGEKAGIFRAGRPALVDAPDPAVRGAFERAAAALGCRLTVAGDVLRCTASTSPATRPQRVEVAGERARYRLELALAGRHQLRNLGLAVLAAERLAGLGFGGLDAEAFTRGVAAARWPGRLEEIALPGGPHVVLDAAHNPDGVETLRAFLADRGEPYALLFGALADKRIDAMLPPLAAGAAATVLTVPPSGRGADPTPWAARVAGPVEVEPEVDIALERGLELAASGGARLVVAGSIVLLGHVRRRLRERFGVPPPATEPLFAMDRAE